MERAIYCCGCEVDVCARLTDGREIYPHRSDLADLPFWKCPTCSNFVGCHHKTKNRTLPLGCIPTKEVKSARQYIHRILDPLWQSGKMSRGSVYAEVAKRLGVKRYHTAELQDIETARRVYSICRSLRAETERASHADEQGET